jgi:hypothetical protein
MIKTIIATPIKTNIKDPMSTVDTRMLSNMPSETLEFWKTFSQISTLVLAIFTIAASVTLFFVNREIGRRQKAESRRFELALEKQKEVTAKAEIEAANLKREVLLLGERPPLLWSDTRLPTVAQLKKFEGQKAEISCVSITSPSNDMEPLSLSVGLRVLLRDSRWVITDLPTMGTFQGKNGLIIEVNPRADARTREAASTLLNELLLVPLKIGWGQKVKEDDSVSTTDVVQILVFQR